MLWDAGGCSADGQACTETPQPLAAADVADVNLLNRLMLTSLVMASAQEEIAFPRTAVRKNSPTPLAFWNGSLNHRSLLLT